MVVVSGLYCRLRWFTLPACPVLGPPPGASPQNVPSVLNGLPVRVSPVGLLPPPARLAPRSSTRDFDRPPPDPRPLLCPSPSPRGSPQTDGVSPRTPTHTQPPGRPPRSVPHEGTRFDARPTRLPSNLSSSDPTLPGQCGLPVVPALSRLATRPPLHRSRTPSPPCVLLLQVRGKVWK